MDKTNGAKPIRLPGLRALLDRQRLADHVAGDAHHQDAERVEPMIDPDWDFPNVNTPQDRLLHTVPNLSKHG